MTIHWQALCGSFQGTVRRGCAGVGLIAALSLAGPVAAGWTAPVTLDSDADVVAAPAFDGQGNAFVLSVGAFVQGTPALTMRLSRSSGASGSWTVLRDWQRSQQAFFAPKVTADAAGNVTVMAVDVTESAGRLTAERWNAVTGWQPPQTVYSFDGTSASFDIAADAQGNVAGWVARSEPEGTALWSLVFDAATQQWAAPMRLLGGTAGAPRLAASPSRQHLLLATPLNSSSGITVQRWSALSPGWSAPEAVPNSQGTVGPQNGGTFEAAVDDAGAASLVYAATWLRSQVLWGQHASPGARWQRQRLVGRGDIFANTGGIAAEGSGNVLACLATAQGQGGAIDVFRFRPGAGWGRETVAALDTNFAQGTQSRVSWLGGGSSAVVAWIDTQLKTAVFDGLVWQPLTVVGGANAAPRLATAPGGAVLLLAGVPGAPGDAVGLMGSWLVP